MPIEVQLRTRNQQSWSEMVENLESVTGTMLKDGRGHADVLSMLRLLGEFSSHEENGTPVPAGLVAQISAGVAPFRRGAGLDVDVSGE